MAQLVPGCARDPNAAKPTSGSFHVRHPYFGRFLRPLFASVPARLHARMVGLFWHLALYRDTPLAVLVARLIATDAGRYSIDWCMFATQIMPNRRAEFLEAVAETGMLRRSFAADYADFFLRMENLATKKQFGRWIYHACQGLYAGASIAYLVYGFELAAQYCPSFYFGTMQNFSKEDTSAFAQCIAQIRRSPDFYAALPCLLWRRSGEMPGLSGLMAQVAWRRLRPAHAQKFLHFLFSLVPQGTERHGVDNKWFIFQRHFTQICDTFFALRRDYRSKALELLEDFYWYFDDLSVFSRLHTVFLKFLHAVCRRPFSHKNLPGTLWCILLQYDLLGDAAALSQIEKFCRSKNTAWLVQRGIRPLVKILNGYAVDLIRAGNTRMLAVARLLGCMARRQRYDILTAVKNCPLMALTPAEENLVPAIAMIDEHRLGKMQNPVPRRLRAHAQGDIQLSEKALSGRLAKLERQLTHFKLHFVAHRIVDGVRRHYGFTEHPQLDHALFMANLISENRRALRGFLAAYTSGDRDYIVKHPATRLWLTKTAVFNRDVWFAGFEIRVTDPAVGELRIATESDPLEKLKLGTYVNSCLGLGGGFMYSAAAAVLDINKHVVYARDTTGRVVARQLLCISDEGKLVPFMVYPIGADQTMQAHFAGFDRRFADALGVPCYDATRGDEYRIANIISRDWWDDSPWDMNAA